MKRSENLYHFSFLFFLLKHNIVRLSAYADDITVLVTGKYDMQIFEEHFFLSFFLNKNWSMCEGLFLKIGLPISTISFNSCNET